MTPATVQLLSPSLSSSAEAELDGYSGYSAGPTQRHARSLSAMVRVKERKKEGEHIPPPPHNKSWSREKCGL